MNPGVFSFRQTHCGSRSRVYLYALDVNVGTNPGMGRYVGLDDGTVGFDFGSSDPTNFRVCIH